MIQTYHFKIKTMKNLLLIVFKIAEVILYLVACWLIGSFLDWCGLLDWLYNLGLAWIIIILVVWIIAVCSWVYTSFKDWIALNKKWVNKIIKD